MDYFFKPALPTSSKYRKEPCLHSFSKLSEAFGPYSGIFIHSFMHSFRKSTLTSQFLDVLRSPKFLCMKNCQGWTGALQKLYMVLTYHNSCTYTSYVEFHVFLTVGSLTDLGYCELGCSSWAISLCKTEICELGIESVGHHTECSVVLSANSRRRGWKHPSLHISYTKCCPCQDFTPFYQDFLGMSYALSLQNLCFEV